MDRLDLELRGVSERIRQYRQKAGITQRALAQRAGISLDAVHRIENGARHPNLESLYRIAQALGLSPVALLEQEQTTRTLRARVERVAHFLQSQPDEVVMAVDECARSIARAVEQSSSPRS